jgi:GH15 family glucan-1,4-alpha-glucosidase
MSRLGLAEELHAGLSWLLDAVSREAPALRVFYALSGDPVSSAMTEVDNVPGYRGSLPVNVGNGAARQTQLGAYGHLLDAAWHYCAHGGILSSASAQMLGDIWSEVKQSYSFYAGSDELDAAVLLMARFGYCEPEDRRLNTTINAIVPSSAPRTRCCTAAAASRARRAPSWPAPAGSSKPSSTQVARQRPSGGLTSSSTTPRMWGCSPRR